MCILDINIYICIYIHISSRYGHTANPRKHLLVRSTAGFLGLGDGLFVGFLV